MNWPSPLPEQVPDAREEIERGYHFDDLRLARRVWSEKIYRGRICRDDEHRFGPSADGVREALLPVCGNAAPDRQASRGRICRHNPTILHVARRKP